MIPSTEDVHKAGQLLALELSDGSHRWTYLERDDGNSPDELPHYCRIRRHDGLELEIGPNRTFAARKKQPQFSIAQSCRTVAWVDSDGEVVDPREYSGGSYNLLPAINVAASKAAAVIATDIRKRVLPDAERFHERALGLVAAWNSWHSDRDAYAAAMGCETPRDGATRDPSRTVYSDDTPDGVGTVDIGVTSTGITIKVGEMSIERAQAVLAALGLEVGS